MSIHVSISEDTKEELDKQKKKAVIASFLIAVLTMATIAALLALLLITIPQQSIDTIVSYVPPASEEDQETTEPTIRNEVALPKPPAASMSAAKVIVSQSMSSVSIPTTLSDMAVESLDFGQASDAELGFGFEETFDMSATDESQSTLFGRMGGSGMKGRLYDLKQSPQNGPTALTPVYDRTTDIGERTSEFSALFRDIAEDRYSEKALKDYFRSSRDLTFSFLLLDRLNAEVGPEAFGVSEEVKPSAWMAIYEGVVLESHPKKIRFLGNFDDILLVYIGREVVFDGSWGRNYTDVFTDMQRVPEYPRYNDYGKGMAMGEYFSLRKGDKIRIVVGEVPGGFVGGGLFVQEKGENYSYEEGEKMPLVPFLTTPLSSVEKERIGELGMNIRTEGIPVFKVGEKRQ